MSLTHTGRDVYIDVSGWHLYLRDVKVPDSGGTTLASGLAAMLAQEGDGADVAGVLGQVPVPLGGGQVGDLKSGIGILGRAWHHDMVGAVGADNWTDKGALHPVMRHGSLGGCFQIQVHGFTESAQ